MQAVRPQVAAASRTVHSFLVAAIVAFVVDTASLAANSSLTQRCAAGVIAFAVFMAAFRLERRKDSFARLSSLARSVYRVRAVIVGAVALGGIVLFIPWLPLSGSEIAVIAASLLALNAIWSVITRSLLGGRTVRRVLIVGDTSQARSVAFDLARDPHPEFELLGALADERGRKAAPNLPILGTIDELEVILGAEAIDTVVLARARDRLALFARLGAYQRTDIEVQELAPFAERVFGKVPVEAITAAWFMYLVHPFYRPYSRLAKRCSDIVASLAIGSVCLPFVPLLWLAVKLSSPGPALYSQTRVGEGGRPFRIYKFRTMRQDAEQNGAQWAAENDPRVTTLGAFFRATRLDEIPQLWNVLRGNMSFVGPRPERPEFVGELERSIPYYQRRHLVKPGLTGWAQVRAGYTDSVSGAADKLGYELYYLKHRSVFLDFVIFLETIRVVLFRSGSR